MIETRSVHQQLLEICQRDLADGLWSAGDRFPSERDLAQKFGISRVTANKVIAKLVSEGWLEIRRGQGTFVAERPTLGSALRQLESFTAFARSLGLRPSTQVPCFRSRAASTDSCALIELGLDHPGEAIHFQRRRRLNGIPVIFEERWVPKDIFHKLSKSDLTNSFLQLCQDKYGLIAEREEAEIVAARPPAMAQFGHGQTSLCLTGLAYDQTGRPLWKQTLYYRGDCFTLRYWSETDQPFPNLSLELSDKFIRQLKKHPH